MEKPPCFLLFVVSQRSGQTELRAICTERSLAARMRKALLESPIESEGIIRIWVEERDMNHLFGCSMYENVSAETAKRLLERGIWKDTERTE